MRGGAQASLIDTDLGPFVVKWCQNPQHRRVLINEAVSSELLKRVGISSPSWAYIHVDRSFLDRNPQIQIQGECDSTPVEPGCHYGSRYPVDPDRGLVYDSLEPKEMSSVSNSDDLLKALVFDLWVDNQDYPQAVFFRIPGKGFRVEMIDHGHALGFNGTEWHLGSSPVRAGFAGTSAIQASAEAAELYQRSIASIRRVNRDDFSQIMAVIPAEWIGNDYDRLSLKFDRLVDREKRLDTLLDAALLRLHRCRPESGRDNMAAVFG